MVDSWNAPKAQDLPRRQDFTAAAYGIERDFRTLVDNIKRIMETVDASEEELLESLSNTKAVAQRGLRLSKVALRVARSRRY